MNHDRNHASTLITAALLTGTLLAWTVPAYADLDKHAWAITSAVNVSGVGIAYGVSEVDNLGPYKAQVSKAGTATDQTFSGTAKVDGSANIGVLKAKAKATDSSGNGDPRGLRASSYALWQDTLYLDEAAGDFDDITVVVGASASLAGDSDDSQLTDMEVAVGGGRVEACNIGCSRPALFGWAYAGADDSSWDGDLLPDWADNPQDAGWETFHSSVSRNDEEESLSASFEGTTTFDVSREFQQVNGKNVFQFSVSLRVNSSTIRGIADTDAGSSLDLLGFRDASGNDLDPSLYSLESGMTMVPEPATLALLAGPGVLMLLGRRRAARA